MSDSDNELQSCMDEFVSKHGHKPNASQLSKFAGCKYSEASRFLRGVKTSSSTTQSSPKSISSPKPKIEKTEKPKPRSYSSTVTSVKKTKNRPCTKYQLDMTAQTFGSCKCGFSKAKHNNNSEWSSSDSDQNEYEQQETVTETQPNDYKEEHEEAEQEQEKVKEVVEQITYENVKQDNTQNEMEKLQNMIKNLQQQLVAKQQEINKSYQEKESFKKTIAEQRAQINKLTQENDTLKQKQNSVKKNETPKQPQVKPKEKKKEVRTSTNRVANAQESVVSHGSLEKKFLCYAIQKLGEKNDTNGFEIKFGDLFNDILFEQIFEGLPGTLFGAKNKKIVKYGAPMLMYPASKDVMIELSSKKLVNTNDVKQLLVEYIEKHMQKYRKDNLLFLLDAMDESKDSYAKACKCFEKYGITQQRV